MKIYRYLIIFCVILTFSCKKNSVDLLNSCKQKSSDALSEKIEIPTPESYLFREVEDNIKNAILKKLKLDLQKNKIKNLNTDWLPSNADTYFIPVINLSLNKNSHGKSIYFFNTDKDSVYFYFMKDGQVISLFKTNFIYKNLFNNHNTETYLMIVSLFGREIANSMDGRTNIAEGWSIYDINKEDTLFKQLEYAIEKSHDNIFLIKLNQKDTYITYFKGDNLFYCNNDSNISSDKIEKLLR